MKTIFYIILGGVFGIILVQAEIISWFRIQEMFRFHAFHMYGIIGSAVAVGALSIFLIRRTQAKSLDGANITLKPKSLQVKSNLLGGILFGLGWAMTGACPGPLYALLGAGHGVIIVAILSAMIGVITYGYLKKYLPH